MLKKLTAEMTAEKTVEKTAANRERGLEKHKQFAEFELEQFENSISF